MRQREALSGTGSGRTRRWAVALLACALTAAGAAAASAHHGEPATGSGTAGESDPGQIGYNTNVASTDTGLTWLPIWSNS